MTMSPGMNQGKPGEVGIGYVTVASLSKPSSEAVSAVVPVSDIVRDLVADSEAFLLCRAPSCWPTVAVSMRVSPFSS